MTTRTLIFGQRSNLSRHLHKAIANSELISTKDILLKTNPMIKYAECKDISIIINSFYPAKQLNKFSDPLSYVEQSIYALSLILNLIKENIEISKKIKKIIYTSSSSVYGNNNLCDENDVLIPLNLHSSLKISSEKLVSNFCKEYQISHDIVRIFNMYGGNDSFSIISKIINSTLDNKIISLINHGSAIRDFVHIDNVVDSYIKLLYSKDSKIVNIASGEGVSIKMILDYLKLQGYSLKIQNIQRSEIKISVANVEVLNKFINTKDFIQVINFISQEIRNRK